MVIQDVSQTYGLDKVEPDVSSGRTGDNVLTQDSRLPASNGTKPDENQTTAESMTSQLNEQVITSFVTLNSSLLLSLGNCKIGTRTGNCVSLRILLQDMDDGSVSESRGRDGDDESEGEDTQRHVEFSIMDEGRGDSEPGKPNRLHRRDTPHHLKNKRVNASLSKEYVALLSEQVRTNN